MNGTLLMLKLPRINVLIFFVFLTSCDTPSQDIQRSQPPEPVQSKNNFKNPASPPAKPASEQPRPAEAETTVSQKAKPKKAAIQSGSTKAGTDTAGASKETDAPARKTAAKRISAGDTAPDFKLKDQNGNEQSLADMLKKDKVALVFYRSADW